LILISDLFDCDALSACDTEITIYCYSASEPTPVKCGITKNITDDAYPIFPERFTFAYIPNQGQVCDFF
jgi:hypothetical protein